MKIVWTAAAVLLCLGVLSQLETKAVGPAQSGATVLDGIALVDVAALIRNHAGLQQQLQKLNDDTRRVEEQFQAERAATAKLVAEARELNASLPERHQLEDNILRRNADLETRLKLQRKVFFERESRLFFIFDAQLNATVRNIAERQGLRLVLRTLKETVDVNDRDSVLSDINKQVLYSRDADITAAVLAEMNAKPVQFDSP